MLTSRIQRNRILMKLEKTAPGLANKTDRLNEYYRAKEKTLEKSHDLRTPPELEFAGN